MLSSKRVSRRVKNEPTEMIDIKEEPCEKNAQMEVDESPRVDEENLCTICTRPVEQPCRIDTCSHIVCFLCMKKWLEHGMHCATCREKPKEFLIVNEGTENEFRFPIAEVEKEKLKRLQEEAGNNIPLDNERQIIRRAKSDIQIVIDRLTEPQRFNHTMQTRRKSKENSQLEIRRNKEYKECVNSMNSLNVLLGYTNRYQVISSDYFRKLIYKYNCEWRSARFDDRPERQRTTYTPKYAMEHRDTERARIMPFLVKELENVNKRLRSIRYREQVAQLIMDRMMDISIHAPQFHRLLILECRMQPNSAERFQHELFNFAASGLNQEEYYTVSCYKLRGAPENQAQNAFAVGGLNQANPEVVTIDDNDEHEDDVIVDSVNLANRQPESFYVRDDPNTSGSERDDLFQRRACLLNVPRVNPDVPVFNPDSQIVFSGFGRLPIALNLHPNPMGLGGLGFPPQIGLPPIYGANRSLNTIGFPREENPLPRLPRPAAPKPNVDQVVTLEDDSDSEPVHAGEDIQLLETRSTPAPDVQVVNENSTPTLAQQEDRPQLSMRIPPLLPTSSAASSQNNVSHDRNSEQQNSSKKSETEDRSKLEKHQRKLEKERKRLTDRGEIESSISWHSREIRKLKEKLDRINSNKHSPHRNGRYIRDRHSSSPHSRPGNSK